MAVPFLDLKAQYAGLRADVDDAIRQVVESQHFVMGPRVESFENELAARLGSEHVVGCASGTDALLLSLRALEAEPDAEVIVPAFTFFATAGAVWNAGLTPAWADVDPVDYNLTAETIEAALTERTRAIVVVHLYGQMADMAPILELAERRGLAVIEDVAQALGARQRLNGTWREAGTLGLFGAYSFFPTKILGAFGDGGAICSDDAAMADRVAKLRVHGGRQMYHHEMVGTNSRLDALQAAVLSVKLPHVDAWIARRREVAERYSRGLADVDGVSVPETRPHNEHVWNVYTLRAQERDRLREHLVGRGIGSNVYYPLPLHLQECFAGLGGKRGQMPASEAAAEQVLSLPMFPELADRQVDEVVEAVADFYG